MSLTGLCIWNPSLASSAETTGGVLEVSENVLHQSSLGWEMGSATVEVAREGCTWADGSLGLHSTTGSDNSVLLARHALVEEIRILSGDLGHRRHDGWLIGIFLWEVNTGTRAHVSVLCRPRLEPVDAGWAASAVCGDFMEVEFDDEVAKVGVDVCAALLGACEEVLARRGIVDCHSAVVCFDILRLVACQCLTRDKLCWRERMGSDLGSTARVVVKDGFAIRGKGSKGSGRVCVKGHCV